MLPSKLIIPSIFFIRFHLSFFYVVDCFFHAHLLYIDSNAADNSHCIRDQQVLFLAHFQII